MMKTSESRGYKEFKKVCNYDLSEKFYPGCVGEEKIVVTDCAEAELKAAFSEIMTALFPYVIIGKFFSKMNDDTRYNDIKSSAFWEFSIDSVDDYENLSDAFCSNNTEGICISLALQEALSKLSPNQRSRVERYYYQQLTFKEIAMQDGVDESSVRESITVAFEKLKNILETYSPVFVPAYSRNLMKWLIRCWA